MKRIPPYSLMARVYEEMIGVDFEDWSRYIERILARYHIQRGGDLLDLGCGTAPVGRRLAARGWSLTGLDGEEAMITEARRLTNAEGIAAEFIKEDIRSFDLERRFDLCLCLHDTVNHLLTLEEVEACFERVSNHLRPDGLFIFDLLTEASIRDNFEGKIFENEAGNYYYHWENEYDPVRKLARVKVTFSPVEPEGDESDQLYYEEHEERVHTIDEINALLYNHGFEVLSVYELFTEFPPHARSYGLNVTARRR